MSRNLPTSLYIVSNLFYLLFKTLFWVFNKLLHYTFKWCSKNKGKHEKSNTGLYFLSCGLLSLIPAFFICNVPETLAPKAHHSHNIIADPLGILTEKNTTEPLQIWLCRSLHVDSQGRPSSGLQARPQNYNQVEDQPVISQNATTTATTSGRCSSKPWAPFPFRDHPDAARTICSDYTHSTCCNHTFHATHPDSGARWCPSWGRQSECCPWESLGWRRFLSAGLSW